ncbi:MAG: EamA family transporter [Acidimicrobiia bacterium]
MGVPPSSVWAALGLTGFGVSAGAFLLQIWAQTIVGATTAAVVVSSESAFGVAVALLVLDERLDLLGLIGGAMILVAIVIVLTKQRDRTSVEAESVSPAH